ncbi:MAG: fasciclin domain-containing protein [Pseudomonadota bacterium]
MKTMIAAVAMSFMLPLATVANAAHHEKDEMMAKPEMAKMDIVGVAAGNEDFSTLVAAVKAAGLVETLQGEGPFTVFAPTNAAFAALPEGTVDMLLKPENKDKLVAILTYHVVPGAVYAKDVTALSSAESVQGDSIDIMVSSGKVMVDNATVVATDIAATNGVIHVIDSVIMPGM